MTFPPKINALAGRGFTLLEIVIVLAVSSMVIAGAIGVMIFSSSERALKDASSQIELLAKKARTAAVLHQIPYAIEIQERSLRLVPFREVKIAQENERFTALGREIGGSASEETNESSKFIHETLSFDSDISLKMRRWNEAKFLNRSDHSFPVWRFDPNGLCEPITVRMEYEDSYAQDTYHPLTATISDSEMEAK